MNLFIRMLLFGVFLTGVQKCNRPRVLSSNNLYIDTSDRQFYTDEYGNSYCTLKISNYSDTSNLWVPVNSLGYIAVLEELVYKKVGQKTIDSLRSTGIGFQTNISYLPILPGSSRPFKLEVFNSAVGRQNDSSSINMFEVCNSTNDPNDKIANVYEPVYVLIEYISNNTLHARQIFFDNDEQRTGIYHPIYLPNYD